MYLRSEPTTFVCPKLPLIGTIDGLQERFKRLHVCQSHRHFVFVDHLREIKTQKLQKKLAHFIKEKNLR